MGAAGDTGTDAGGTADASGAAGTETGGDRSVDPRTNAGKISRFEDLG